MNNLEKENFKNQLKLARVFKAVISAGLVAPVFVSVSSCEKANPVIEETETSQTSEKIATPATETTSPTTEKVPETTVLQEFEASMIKNRLIFPPSARQFSQEHPEATFDFVPDAPLPLWYLYDDEKTKEGQVFIFIVSAVVAGDFKKGIGETGKEELLLPVAFQDPTTNEFLIRDISFGDTEFFETIEKGAWNNYLSGGIDTVFLNDYTFIGKETYEARSAHFEELKANLQAGDQIAFSLLTEKPSYWADVGDSVPEGVDPDYAKIYLKIIDNFLESYYPNNELFYKAMKENKELPELKIYPWTFYVNKLTEE